MCDEAFNYLTSAQQMCATQRDDPRTCRVRGCTKPAVYDVPCDWCATHWNAWWEWPRTSKDPEPEWMRDR